MRQTAMWFPFCRRFFSLSQQFTWIEIYMIYLLTITLTFQMMTLRRTRTGFENEDNEEDEIPALEISQIATSSHYLGTDCHVWSETPKDCHGRAAPATVLIFVPKARSTAENLEDPGNIFRLFMDDIIKKIYKHTNEQMERRKE